MIRILTKLGIEGNFLNFIKIIYTKPTNNIIIIINDETLSTFL